MEIVNEKEAIVVGELSPNRTVEDTVEIDSKTPSTKITVTKSLSSLSLVYDINYILNFKICTLEDVQIATYIHVLAVIQHCIPNKLYFLLATRYLFWMFYINIL